MAITKYIGACLLGIAACLFFEIVDIDYLWWYLFGSIVGVLLFVIFFYQVVADVWWVLGITFLPLVMEVILHFAKKPRLRSWRPLWVGFPIGFVGASGIYLFTELARSV